MRTWLGGDKPMKITHSPTSRQLVPPAEYDGPYKGKLTVTLLDTEDEVVKQCPATTFPAKLGCAYQFRRALHRRAIRGMPHLPGQPRDRGKLGLHVSNDLPPRAWPLQWLGWRSQGSEGSAMTPRPVA